VSDPLEPTRIDPVDRLAILAAALPGAAVRQRRIAAPFDAVWRVIEDLENAAPRYERDVSRVQILHSHGQTMHLLIGYSAGGEETMDVKLTRGWCLMQSATFIAAFAARPLGSETMLTHLEHRRSGTWPPGQGRSLNRRAAYTKIDQELRTIETLASRAGG
jgi:hypothetical protein